MSIGKKEKRGFRSTQSLFNHHPSSSVAAGNMMNHQVLDRCLRFDTARSNYNAFPCR
jgi:hypothetical protein